MVDDVLAALDGVRRSGDGWIARCPSHDDQHQSLSVHVGEGARVLVHCHAGCRFADIVRDAGLTPAHFAATTGTTNGRRIVASYEYRDLQRRVHYEIVRFAPKDFRPRRPDGANGWHWNLHTVGPLLYRWPDLLGVDEVLVVEGEKDVETCWAAGVAATCNHGGSSGWTATHAEQLRTAGVVRVIVVPDRDRAGVAHAARVAQTCHAVGLEVRVYQLPGDIRPKDGPDITDFVQAGGSLPALLTAAHQAPRWSAGPTEPGVPLISLADFLAEPDETEQWQIGQRLPRGGIGLLAGKPKCGKTTLVITLAFAVARGEPFLTWPTAPGPVWYLAFEGQRAVLRRQFRRLSHDPQAEPVRFFLGQSTPDFLGQLHAQAARERPALVIIDTLQRCLQLRDVNDYAEATTKLDPVLALARETEATVVLLHHATKSDRTDLDNVLGSTAFAGSVETVFLLTKSGTDRVLATRQRTGEDLDPTLVRLDPSTGLVTLGPTRREATDAARAEELLQLLEVAQRWLTRDEVLERSEGRHEETRTALARLLDQGRIVRVGEGKRGAPFHYGLSTFPVFRSQPSRGPAGPETETALFTNEISKKAGPDHEAPGTGFSGARERNPEGH